jgi:hypothetical protein
LRTLANSPDTYRIRASLEGSVRLEFLAAEDCGVFPDCASWLASSSGKTGMLSPDEKFPAEFRSDAGKRGSFGKSAAANTMTSNEMANQLDITNRVPPQRGLRYFMMRRAPCVVVPGKIIARPP